MERIDELKDSEIGQYELKIEKFRSTRGLSQYNGNAGGGSTDPGRQTVDPLLGNPYKKPPESWVTFCCVQYGFLSFFYSIIYCRFPK